MTGYPVLEFQVATAAPTGGKYPETLVRIINHASTQWGVAVSPPNEEDQVEVKEPSSVTLRFSGNDECQALIQGLDFVSTLLRRTVKRRRKSPARQAPLTAKKSTR